jgi:hypothetical protein
MLGTIVSVKHTVELEDLRDFIPHPMGVVYSGLLAFAQCFSGFGFLERDVV